MGEEERDLTSQESCRLNDFKMAIELLSMNNYRDSSRLSISLLQPSSEACVTLLMSKQEGINVKRIRLHFILFLFRVLVLMVVL